MADAFEQTHLALGNRASIEHDVALADGSCVRLSTQESLSQTNNISGTIDLARTDIYTVRKRLWDSFKPSRARTEATDYDFLPRKALTAILTEKTIQSLLQQRPEMTRISLDDITGYKRRIKIFAILLLIEKTQYMWHIIQQGITDYDLPLKRDCLQTCLRKEAATIRAFLSSQYEVNVPIWDFSAHQLQKVKFDWDQRLPILLKHRLSSGGQGVVWKVEIHRDHYETKTQSNRWECLHQGPEFALKEFANEDHFRDELKALKLFSQHDSKHANLVKALAAYSHCDKHFLIFPLAEGNLDKFWQELGTSFWDPLWLLTQCHGLTDGLGRVHQYRIKDPSSKDKRLLGRHGDIKPENVLRFMDHSTGKDRLVLSDFTLMRFHAEGSNKDTTVGRIGGTRTYRAPEVTFMSGKRVSQKYDVWSLGCVFLEFISCHLVGYDATRGESFKGHDGRDYQSFDTVRLEEDFLESGIPEDKYFLYKPGLQEAEVKASVMQWFLYLHGQRHCTDALHSFLDLIQEHMLLTKPERRWSIKRVLERLTEILDKSGYHGVAADYCRVGRPWATSHSNQFPPLWDDDEHRRRHQQHFDTQRSTQSDSISIAISGGSTKSTDREHLHDAAGSQHDFGQFENLFADDISSSQRLGPSQTHTIVATTASVPQRDGDMLQNGPTPRVNRAENPSKATTDSSRQMLSLPRGSARVTGHSLDLSPVILDQNSPYTALLNVNGNIRVSQQPPEIDFLTTPATSHCPDSSEAHSTCTEDPRQSMSSYTDASVFEVAERSVRSNQPEDSHYVTGKDMSKPEAPAPSLAGGSTILNGVERTNINRGAEDPELRSSGGHGLVSLWEKMRSLRRRAFRPIRRGRRSGA